VEAVPVDEACSEERGRPAGSFEDFFATEYRRVLGLASALCGRRVLAEEVTQDAFVAALRHWERISGYDDPAAWVRRVACNLATSSFRRRAREMRALLTLTSRRIVADELEADDATFWEAVRALPPRQRQCIALRYLEDRSVAEIARVLHIAEATVRVHLHAGRSNLAARLDEELEEETP
jgi:RNA polymerase sigma-70 factor (ECF subfamily)